MSAGDLLLLWTDGLTRMVPDREIADVLTRQKDPQKAADELIALPTSGAARTTTPLSSCT
jgi:serine/threonine protein phosphatase PrpC